MSNYTFPYFGDYTIAFKALLGREKKIIITKPSVRTLSLGVKNSPEFICLPYKITLGNILENIALGADHVILLEMKAGKQEGECRLSYYSLLQELVIRKSGTKINFETLNFDSILPSLKNISPKKSYFMIIYEILIFLEKIWAIDKLSELVHYFQPREVLKGSVKKIYLESLQKIDEANSIRKVIMVRRNLKSQFKQIKIDTHRRILKIGLIGEIYLLYDNLIANNLDEFLASRGVEIHKFTTLSVFIKYSFFKDMFIRHFNKVSGKYAKGHFGGHGLDSIAHLIEAKNKGFNGVIHVLPFGCMPESGVRPILNQVAQDKAFPFLSLSLDEQTGTAGLETRLEAFIDMIK